MSRFSRPTLPELDARIARTLADLGRANGEAYTELLGTLAGLRGVRAQVEAERWARVGPELLAVLKGLTPDYPLSDCPANQKWMRAQRAIAEAEGTVPPATESSKGY